MPGMGMMPGSHAAMPGSQGGPAGPGGQDDWVPKSYLEKGRLEKFFQYFLDGMGVGMMPGSHAAMPGSQGGPAGPGGQDDWVPKSYLEKGRLAKNYEISFWDSQTSRCPGSPWWAYVY